MDTGLILRSLILIVATSKCISAAVSDGGPTFAPPFALNVLQNVINFTSLGKIKANNSVLFFIVDINSTIKFEGDGNPNWKEITLNKDLDDCLQLSRYSEPRSHFCIDHHSGELYTTPILAQSKPPPNTKYNLQLRAQSVTGASTDRLFSVTILSQCAQITISYEKIISSKTCDVNNIDSHVFSRNTVPVSTFNKTISMDFGVYFITMLSVDLSNTRPPEAGTRNVHILLKYHGTMQNVSFVFISAKKYYLDLDPIFSYSNSITFQVLLSLSYKEGEVSTTGKYSLDQNIFTFHGFRGLQDYCDAALIDCFDLTESYMQNVKNLPECEKHVDEHMFKLKYGKCAAGALPHLSNSSLTLDFPIQSMVKIVNGSYLQKNPSLVFNLNKVTGSNDGDFGTNIQHPFQCTSITQFDGPGRYFCQNGNNGDLYTTSYAENKIKHNDVYTFYMEAMTKTIPFRKTSFIFNLTFQDSCIAGSTVYTQLVHPEDLCGNIFNKLSATGGTTGGTVGLMFSTNEFMKAILGFRVDSSVISDSAKKVQVKLTVGTTNITKTFVHIIQRYNGQAYHYFPVRNFTIEMKAKHNVRFQIFDWSLDGNVRQITITNFNQVKMFYSESWSNCAKAECLNMYQTWKDSLVAVQNNFRCKEDSSFASVFYERCLNLNPGFTVGPSHELTTVGGCSYKAIIDLQEFTYYLRNNSTRVNITITDQPARQRRDAASDPNLSAYVVPSLQIKSYDQQGEYQCVVYDRSRMSAPVKSSKITVQLRDPSFSETATSTQGTAGLPLTLRGCSYQADVQLSLNQMYYLKNDAEKIDLNGSSLNGRFPNLQFDKLKFSDSGSYQCVIFVEGFMEKPILSDKTNIIVNEMNVTIRSNPQILSTNFGTFSVSGCSYQSGVYLMNYSYILHNGKTRINVSSTSEGNQHFFSPYVINNYDQIGSYQCIIHDQSIMKKPAQSLVATKNFTAPSLQSKPTIIGTIPRFAGDQIHISACKLQSQLPLDGKQLYWMKTYNGEITIIPANSTYFEGEHTMKDFITMELKLSDQGLYQCGLNITKLMATPSLLPGVDIKLNALDATFKSNPSVDYINGRPVIYGCSYESQKDLSRSLYYRLNGTIYVPIISKTPDGEFEEDVSGEENVFLSTNGTYSFPNLTIDKYELVGSYECYIFNNNTMREPVVSFKTIFVTLPAPVVITSPTLKIAPRKVGDPVTIQNCKFSSLSTDIKASRFNWMKDGFVRMSIDGGIESLLGRTTNIYNIPGRSYRKSDNSTQGFFQCTVYIPELGIEVRSEKVNVQFEDISETRVIVKIDQKFTPELSNSSSFEYITLKKKVETKVNDALKKLGTDSSNQVVEVIGFSQGSVNAITRVRFVEVSPQQRLDYCDTLKDLAVTKGNDLSVVSVKVNSLDCCFEDKTGESSFKGVYIYNKTLVNSTQTQVLKNCSYWDVGKSYRVCNKDLEFGPQWSVVNLEECLALSVTTQNLEVLSEVIVCDRRIVVNCASVEEVARNLSAVVTNGTNITTQQDVTYIATIITKLVNALSNAVTFSDVNKVANDIIDTVNRVLDANTSIVATAQNNSQSATTILKNLDQLAGTLGLILKQTNGDNFNVSRPNIALNVGYVERGNMTIYSYEKSNGNVEIVMTTNTSSVPSNIFSSIHIPSATFPDKKQVLFSYFFRQDALFLSENKIKDIIANTINLKRLIQSTVLAATLGDRRIANLTDNLILLKFRKSYYENTDGLSTCQFWNFDKGLFGVWSPTGCKRILNEDGQYVTCKCTHLTNFAILLDTSQTQSNPLELQIITWIGCGLSIAGLALTIITFLAFRNLRKKLPPKILLSLSVSLLILLIVFLAGVEQTDPEEGCKAVAVLIHYFTITSFCWMAVEGVNLYRCFVKIFKRGSSGKFLKKASLFAWGVPAIVVIATAAAQPDNLTSENFCIVNGYSFYFGVLLPVAVIIFGNFIVLGLVMRGLTKNVINRPKENEENYFLHQARVSFACAVLLGLTFVFGILAVGKATTFFQWLFCIFNSLQGFFIFVFYTLRNTEARKEWKRCLGMSSSQNTTLSTGAAAKHYELGQRGGDPQTYSSGNTGTTSR